MRGVVEVYAHRRRISSTVKCNGKTQNYLKKGVPQKDNTFIIMESKVLCSTGVRATVGASCLVAETLFIRGLEQSK